MLVDDQRAAAGRGSGAGGPGRRRPATRCGPGRLARRLRAAHKPLIVVQDRDWESLPTEARERVRALQREYVELWADPAAPAAPRAEPGPGPGDGARDVRADQLHAAQRLLPPDGDARRCCARWRSAPSTREPSGPTTTLTGMRWDARGTIALLVSALVGVTAGVIVGISSGSPGASTADPEDPTPGASTAGSPTDPLGLGAPLVQPRLHRPEDPGRRLGHGETSGALIAPSPPTPTRREVPRDRRLLQHPLRRRRSRTHRRTSSTSGPSTPLSEPCSLRMSVDHKSDVGHQPQANVQIHVPCLCVLDPATFPELAVGMLPTPETASTSGPCSGCWSTSARTRSTTSPASTTPRRRTWSSRSRCSTPSRSTRKGLVEESTWQMLRDRGCVELRLLSAACSTCG